MSRKQSLRRDLFGPIDRRVFQLAPLHLKTKQFSIRTQIVTHKPATTAVRAIGQHLSSYTFPKGQ
jgi:hypothetical protein